MTTFLFFAWLLLLLAGSATLPSYEWVGVTFFVLAAAVSVAWLICLIRDDMRVKRALREHPAFEEQLNKSRNRKRD